MTQVAPSSPPASTPGLEFIILRPTPTLNDHDLKRAMGLAGKRPLRPAVQKQMDRLVATLLPRCQPRLVLGLGHVGVVDALLPDFATLHRYLATAEHAALMAGTAGLPEPAAKMAAESGDGDPLQAFVENAVSVALVRKLFSWARQYLKDRWSTAEAGEPLTPGNCGVPLHIQRSLLRQLPLHKVGIQYDEIRDLLMPLASVSGLIGVGAYPAVDDVSCIRCPSQDCPLRESAFDPRRFQELTWFCSKPKPAE